MPVILQLHVIETSGRLAEELEDLTSFELVLAVMDVESRFDRFAVSSAGAVGLMQVMPFWPQQLGMTMLEATRERTAASVPPIPATAPWSLRFRMARDDCSVS